MRQTLFAIPEEFQGVAVFGVGLLLAVWLVFATVAIGVQWFRGGWTADLRGFLWTVGIVALVIVGLSPKLVVVLDDGGRGLPIRGYGVMLLLAIVAGVSLAVYRGRRVGLAPDSIINLAFCMIVFGLLGARLFFIIQYWELLRGATLQETIGNLFNFVEGGLVVYGSLIGALAAAIWYLRRQKLPLLGMGDLIAPSLALGLAIGRVGCLMNGCCYGGVCEKPWAVTFPANSPVYLDQKGLGQLHGLTLAQHEEGQTVVRSVVSGGAAEQAGLAPGAVIRAVNGVPVTSLETARRALENSSGLLRLETGQGAVSILAEFPTRSLPVHPTQIYSSINAALLCLVLLAFFPYRRRDGEVIALTLTLYPIGRFLLEQIRQDEPGKFGTNLTISQLVSLVLLGIAFGLWCYLRSQPRRSAWPESDDARATIKDGSECGEPIVAG